MTIKIKLALTILIITAVLVLSGKDGVTILPIVNPAPIKEAGLHVLVVEEVGDRPTIDRGQLVVLNSQLWIEDVLTAGGKFRKYDQHAPTENMLPVWRDAMSRKRTELPWLVISNGKSGEEIPLPNTVSSMQDLIIKYKDK